MARSNYEEIMNSLLQSKHVTICFDDEHHNLRVHTALKDFKQQLTFLLDKMKNFQIIWNSDKTSQNDESTLNDVVMWSSTLVFIDKCNFSK